MSQHKFSVVTTFNHKGYLDYGQRMIETFLNAWPADVNMLVYAENCIVTQHAPNLTVIDLEKASPDLCAFKQKWQHVPMANGDVSTDPVRSKRRDAGKGFKWDAVRFAHKVYAIFAAAQCCKSDWLIWMDADMVCHSEITTEYLNRMISNDYDLCFLGRTGKYTECGLYAINIGSSTGRRFLAKFQALYDQGDIFALDEWHDSFVFDHVRSLISVRELDWSEGIVQGEGHPLINTSWGAYLDHLKGDRKQLGHSKSKDLKVTRTEKYWQSV
jgi:hypothetical protein